MLLKTYRLPTLRILLPGLVLVDLMALAYLARRGPGHVAAKLASYAWLTCHLRSILEARGRTQRLRAIDDRRLLAPLVASIPVEQLAPVWLARVADAIIRALLAGYRRRVLSVVH
jgi:hypothetical protein